MKPFRSRLPLHTKLRVSLTAVAQSLSRPSQLALCACFALAVLGILVWLPNLGLLGAVTLGSHLSFEGRIGFVASAYGSLFTNYSAVQGLTLVIYSVLAGLNAVMLVSVVPRSLNQALASGTTGLWAVTAAALGAGCAACGTSFLAPLVGGLIGTASASLTGTIGAFVDVAGIGLICYSIYRLGLVSAGQTVLKHHTPNRP